jgi:hypothetical protein
MKLDFTPVVLAFGIGLATFALLRLKRVVPDVKFKNVRYNQLKNEINLIVENTSDKTVYVKPALRLIRLTPADEWRAKKYGTNSPVPMMSAAAGSVIKGYELLGEYAEPVPVAARQTTMISYPVMRDFGIKAYDNVKVDSPVGGDPALLEGSVSRTLRMSIAGLDLSEEFGNEILSFLNEQLKADGRLPSEEGGIKPTLLAPNPADGGVPEAPAASALSERRSEFPLQAMCYCCGKEKWLSWVVGGNHVCQDCRDFLGTGQAVGGMAGGRITEVMEVEEADLEGAPGLEFVDSPQIDLKPRHRRILDMLLSESTLSAKEISGRLGRDRKAVATDLRYLLRNNLIDRVKIRGSYKYFSLRDGDQVVITEGKDEEEGQVLPPKGAS